jgi:hypothetical protein
MRDDRTWRAALVLVAVLGVVAAIPAGAVTYAQRGYVVGNGGTPGASPAYILQGTAGQAAVGASFLKLYTLCHGFWCYGGVRTVAVDLPDPSLPPQALPTQLELSAPMPNPTVGEASFSLALPKAADVRFAVYDVRGRRVGREYAGRFDAGTHRLEWYGPGGAAGSGVYFAQLWVDGKLEAQRRIVTLR